MSRRGWYIGCSEDEVGEAAILVGDRARIERIADHLEGPAFVSENRGLRTVTGLRSGKRVTASAFGMGGPIAAVVLHARSTSALALVAAGVARMERDGVLWILRRKGKGSPVTESEAMAAGRGAGLIDVTASVPPERRDPPELCTTSVHGGGRIDRDYATDGVQDTVGQHIQMATGGSDHHARLTVMSLAGLASLTPREPVP